MSENARKRNVRRAHELGYYVDDDGRVIAPTGRQRKTLRESHGFESFAVCLPELGKGRRANVIVHQLVAFQKWGPDWDADGSIVIHENGNKLDNRPDNVTRGTRSEAQLRVPMALRHLYGANAARRLRALSDAQVAALRAERAAGASYRVLCERYGIAKATVSYIVNGKTY